MSRVKAVKLNVAFSIGSQIVVVLLSFLTRTLFIKYLGAQILGLSGLLTNILSLLSLAELGLSSAIVYSLYQPIAENNHNKIIQYITFFKKAYNYIALFVLIVGLALLPFLSFFLNDSDQNIPNFKIYYLLFLISTVFSYLNSYKRTLLIANQLQYLDNINNIIFTVFKNALQVIVLFFFSSFILYLIIQILSIILSNYFITKKANSIFPFIKNYKELSLEDIDKRKLVNDVFSLSLHKFAGVLVFGISSLIIAKFLNVKMVGYYSNYLLILTSINGLIILIFTSLTASIGNLIVENNKEKLTNIFKIADLINFFIYVFVAIMIILCINDFIKLWVGNEFIFKDEIVFVLGLNFFITGRRLNVLVFKQAMGLFNKDRYKPIFEGVLNIFLSVLLIQKYGIIGVLLATLISTIGVAFWIEIIVVFKYGFKQSSKEYFLDYLVKLIIFLVLYFLFNYLNSFFLIDGFKGLFFKAVINSLSLTLCLFLLFFKTKVFNNALLFLSTFINLKKIIFK